MIFTQLPPVHHLAASGHAHYTPFHSSPLAPQTPRPTNKPDPEPIHFSFSPSHDTNAATTPSASRTPQENNPNPNHTATADITTPTRPKTTRSYAQRYASTISHPLASSSTSPSARDKRRHAFLNRVKQDRERDPARFQGRAEQFMQMEHVAERREWSAEMEKRAERIVRGFGGLEGPEEPEDEFDYGEDEDEGMEGGYQEDDSRALDEFISQEQAADMALLEDNRSYDASQKQTQTGDFGSFSDDEYDHLFMDLVEGQGHEGMDMSGG